MTDIVKMFTGGFWRYVVAWLLPCVGFLSALLLTAYPSVKSLPVLTRIHALASSNSTLGGLIFGLGALGISALLALCYEPVYRLWEGYPWPRPLFIAGRSREIKRYKSLSKRINKHVDRVEEAKGADDRDLAAYNSTRGALLREARRLFPEYEEDFLPTRLGNGLRAAERYGYERYRLDTQVLWYELGAVTPEPLSEDLDSVRGTVDFFISAATLSCIYALTMFIIAMAKVDLALAGYALVGVFFSRLAYLRAARGVGAIAKAQQAIVNVSRAGLADVFGLVLPADIDDEKEMWSAVVAFVLDGAESHHALKAWRKPPAVERKDDNDDFVAARSSMGRPGRRRSRG